MKMATRFFMRDADMTHQPTFSRQSARIGGWMLFFAALGLIGITLVGSTAPAAQDANTIKVGILHSFTGSLAITETQLKDAELLAIEEINKAGCVQSQVWKGSCVE
jgi:ABC-type branched-subunit amino acid transport system substrate-binding protein